MSLQLAPSVGLSGAVVIFTSNQIMSLHLWGPNDNIILLILSVEGTGRLVCIPLILVEVSLDVGVMFLMRRIPRPCSERLIICEEVYVAIVGEGLLLILIPLW